MTDVFLELRCAERRRKVDGSDRDRLDILKAAARRAVHNSLLALFDNWDASPVVTAPVFYDFKVRSLNESELRAPMRKGEFRFTGGPPKFE